MNKILKTKNRGKNYKRIFKNPIERKFAKLWDDLNDVKDSKDIIEALLRDEVTDRDRMVAATVFQWLGSPVGQMVLIQLREQPFTENKGTTFYRKIGV